MTASDDSLNDEMRALERDIEQARAGLEQTLAALERRLSPGALADHAARIVRENGEDLGRDLATRIRNHPVPAVLVGVGIAWLLMATPRREPDVDGG